MLAPPARPEHPEVHVVRTTAHCELRFRARAPFRRPGADVLIDALRTTLEDADFSRVPPSWAAGQQARMWAVSAAGDLAFPLAPASRPGEWLALTCLARDG